MPTNQQRREAAQRKLERQLVRRQEQERQRRQRLIVVGVVVTVLLVGGGIWFATTRGGTKSTTVAAPTSGATAATASSAAAPKTPCTYTKAGKAAKPVKAPTNLSPANTGTVAASITLNGAKVDVTLDRSAAPCTVNSFLSLASQGFYNSSPCWRLTANAPLSVLQCGDPTGVGNGGPGYTFGDELTKTKTYPRGTIAMANSGANTNGSQFFIVYQNSTLSPSYTVFGKVSDAGMTVIDAIAAKGVKNNAQDGPPAAPVVMNSVSIPQDAVTATGTYATSAAASSKAVGSNAVGSNAATAAGGSGATPGKAASSATSAVTTSK